MLNLWQIEFKELGFQLFEPELFLQPHTASLGEFNFGND